MQVKCCCLQIACKSFDPQANLDKAARLVRQAADCGADIVLLPEYLTTGCIYDRRLHEFAESCTGPTVRALRCLSGDTKCWIAGGVVERDGPRVCNTLLLVGPGGELYSYRKRCLAFFENLYFHAGQSAGIVNTPFGRLGLMVCWDMVHARLAREMTGQIDLLMIGSAWPRLAGGSVPLWGLQHWSDRQPVERPRALARRLGVPVVFCNSTGPWETPVPWTGMSYRSAMAGHSAVIDASGHTIASAGCEETIVSAELTISPRVASPFGHAA